MPALPVRPSLRHLKNEAKDLHKALAAGDAGAVERVRQHLPSLAHGDKPPEGISLDRIEKKVIEATLRQTGGNVLRASQLLGMSRGALRYKLAKHKINPQAMAKKTLVES